MLTRWQMYSLSYLYQSMGDNNFADRCELAAFNALPVMVCGVIGLDIANTVLTAYR